MNTYYYEVFNDIKIDEKGYIYTKELMISYVKLFNMKDYITKEEIEIIINKMKECLSIFLIQSPEHLNELIKILKELKFEKSPKLNIQYGEFCGKKKEGETQIIRHPMTAKGELRKVMHLGFNNMWDAFEYNLKDGRATKNFIGYRKKINENEFENKYSWITYEEAYIKILNFCRGLNVLNLCPLHPIEDDDSFRFLGIYSRNRPEWLLSYFGAVRDSITIVPVLDLDTNSLEYIFSQTKLTTIVIEVRYLEKCLGLAKNKKTGDIKNLIVLDKNEDEKSCEELTKLGFKIYTWDQIEREGKEKGKDLKFHSPGPETINSINYSSGTIGYPKGAKITHNSILLNTDVIEMIGLYLKAESDIYISFLPLGHIMETLVMAVLVSRGIPIGFYNGNISNLFQDMQILHPTCMCGVPRIFTRIYEIIKNMVIKLPIFKQELICTALNLKMKDYSEKRMLTNLLWDDIIFKQCRDFLGGRMRFMLIGSAPMDNFILNYLRCLFSCDIVEGYGQIEGTAGILLTKTYDLTTGHLGGPGYSAELKLIDRPELNYKITDIDPETGKWRPRGELCIRGPILFKGYLSLKYETNECLDRDGWFHTGDVAEIIPEYGNAVKIIDRVKETFKLQQGGYISPSMIENKLYKCKYIDQIIVYGDQFKNYLVGIVVPKSKDVIEFLKSKGIKNITKENYKDYYEDQDLINDILKEINDFSRLNDIEGNKIVKKVYLSKEFFTFENGLLTSTFKIRRHNAKKYFLKEIEKMYCE